MGTEQVHYQAPTHGAKQMEIRLVLDPGVVDLVLREHAACGGDWGKLAWPGSVVWDFGATALTDVVKEHQRMMALEAEDAEQG